jgi:glutathione synthase
LINRFQPLLLWESYLEHPAMSSSLVQEAVSYALSHGIVVSTGPAMQTHAPMTVRPSPMDATCHAQALALGPLLNTMIARIAADHDYLRSTLAETAAADPSFTGRLLALLGSGPDPGTGVELGIYRHDYFVHQESPTVKPVLRMVEMNCIAASFACLGTRTSRMHRYLSTHPNGIDPQSKSDNNVAPKADVLKALPENDAMGGLVSGLAAAHKAYVEPLVMPNKIRGLENHQIQSFEHPEMRAIMVVQPGERNVFDQDLLRIALWDDHKIDMVRMTLAEINAFGSISDRGRLVITRPKPAHPFIATLVYYRAGYGPDDYPSEAEWDARALIECTSAVKCPSIAAQLVGTKKIQQVLDLPGEVERFIKVQTDADLIRSCFACQYTLSPGAEGDEAAQLGITRPNDFVLKPQREGGGNNLYSTKMKAALERMTVQERSAYILMERLRPVVARNILVRNGNSEEADVVSEFGVYGIHVMVDGKDTQNSVGGTLLRSKLATQDDGGVAAGVAVLDSPMLVGEH